MDELMDEMPADVFAELIAYMQIHGGAGEMDEQDQLKAALMKMNGKT